MAAQVIGVLHTTPSGILLRNFFFKFNIRLWITRLTGSSGFNKVLMGFQSTQSKPGGSPFHLYRYLFLFNSIASVHYWLDNDEVLDVFLLL